MLLYMLGVHCDISVSALIFGMCFVAGFIPKRLYVTRDRSDGHRSSGKY